MKKKKSMREKCKYLHPKTECEEFKRNKCDLGSQCSKKHGGQKKIKPTQTKRDGNRKKEYATGKEPRIEQPINGSQDGKKRGATKHN